MKEQSLKLANELVVASSEMEYNHIVNDWKLLSDSSAMIRRLVEELDYLKDQISFYEIKNLDSGIIGKIGDSPIHDLVHRTTPQTKKSEPVVYWDGKHFASKEKSSLADIPLYTTPQTKPLSDDEIHSMWDKLESAKSIKIKYWMFARRIEERHGIR